MVGTYITQSDQLGVAGLRSRGLLEWKLPSEPANFQPGPAQRTAPKKTAPNRPMLPRLTVSANRKLALLASTCYYTSIRLGRTGTRSRRRSRDSRRPQASHHGPPRAGWPLWLVQIHGDAILETCACDPPVRAHVTLFHASSPCPLPSALWPSRQCCSPLCWVRVPTGYYGAPVVDTTRRLPKTCPSPAVPALGNPDVAVNRSTGSPTGGWRKRLKRRAGCWWARCMTSDDKMASSSLSVPAPVRPIRLWVPTNITIHCDGCRRQLSSAFRVAEGGTRARLARHGWR